MADKETKIECCPLCHKQMALRKGAMGHHFIAHEEASSKPHQGCYYSMQTLYTDVEGEVSDMVAAHNALSIAAQPKDPKSYEDMAVEIDEAICQAESTCRNHARRHLTKGEARQVIAVKLSELMQPQRSGYVHGVWWKEKVHDVADLISKTIGGGDENERYYRIKIYDSMTTTLDDYFSELMQPRDVEGLDEAVQPELVVAVQAKSVEIAKTFRRMIDNPTDTLRLLKPLDEECLTEMIYDNILAAVRPFCDPETLRQRDALLVACQSIASVDSPESMPQFYDLNGGPLGVIEKMVNEATKAIADCEATK